MPVRRIVAATDVPATAASPQVDPIAADLQAFLATRGAGNYVLDAVGVRTRQEKSTWAMLLQVLDS